MLTKLIQDMTCLGCTSISHATLCAYTYLELLRRQKARKFFDASYHYNAKVKKLYCRGKYTEKGPSKIFVPIHSSGTLDPQTWDDHFHLTIELHAPNSLVLVIWEADSTFVFYEVSKGLGSPPQGKSSKNSLLHKQYSEEPSTSTLS